MRTNTRKEAEARLQEVGPFIVRKRNPRGIANWLYWTKGDKWSFNLELAWDLQTRPQAQAVSRHLVGAEVLRRAEAEDGKSGKNGSDAKPAVAQELELVPAIGSPVSAGGLADLERCERSVQHGMQEAGLALLEVRDKGLYRLKGYKSWEDYLADRWGISARHGHRLCADAETKQKLLTEAGSDPVAKLVPTLKESHTRELARIEPAKRLAALKTAVELAAPEQPRAKHFAEAAGRVTRQACTEPLPRFRQEVAAGSTAAHENDLRAMSNGIRDTMACLGALEDGLERLGDAVMRSNVQRAFSLLRPVLVKYAGMDNMRAERIDGQKKDPVLEARFHAVDAEVEAAAAAQLLEGAPGKADSTRPAALFHAKCAVEQLQSLKRVLNGEAPISDLRSQISKDSAPALETPNRTASHRAELKARLQEAARARWEKERRSR